VHRPLNFGGLAVGVVLMIGGAAILTHTSKYADAWRDSRTRIGMTRRQAIWGGVVVIVCGAITAVTSFFS
jgi:hypothetical protein